MLQRATSETACMWLGIHVLFFAQAAWGTHADAGSCKIKVGGQLEATPHVNPTWGQTTLSKKFQTATPIPMVGDSCEALCTN